MAQNSSLVNISNTWIVSNGNASDQNVLTSENDSLGMAANFYIDPSLSGKGYRFDINFQIVQIGGLIVAKNFWYSQCKGLHYPLMLDAIVPGGGDYAVGVIAAHASNLNVHGGNTSNAENHNQGMYMLRVYLYVDTDKYGKLSDAEFGELAQARGAPQFAIADDYFFWCN